MARQCDVCAKKRNLARKLNKLRGKYNPTKKRPQKPNLQYVKLASGKRLLVCTKCRKTLVKNNLV